MGRIPNLKEYAKYGHTEESLIEASKIKHKIIEVLNRASFVKDENRYIAEFGKAVTRDELFYLRAMEQECNRNNIQFRRRYVSDISISYYNKHKYELDKVSDHIVYRFNSEYELEYYVQIVNRFINYLNKIGINIIIDDKLQVLRTEKSNTLPKDMNKNAFNAYIIEFLTELHREYEARTEPSYYNALEIFRYRITSNLL